MIDCETLIRALLNDLAHAASNEEREAYDPTWLRGYVTGASMAAQTALELPEVALARVNHTRELHLSVIGIDAPLPYPPAEHLAAGFHVIHDVKAMAGGCCFTSLMTYATHH